MVKSHFSFIAGLFMLLMFASCTNSAKSRLLDAKIARLVEADYKAVAVSFGNGSPNAANFYVFKNALWKNGDIPILYMRFMLDKHCNCIKHFQFWDMRDRDRNSSTCGITNNTITFQLKSAASDAKPSNMPILLLGEGYASLLDTCIYRFRGDTLLLVNKAADTVFFVRNEENQ